MSYSLVLEFQVNVFYGDFALSVFLVEALLLKALPFALIKD
jgi:hypothetical protein